MPPSQSDVASHDEGTEVDTDVLYPALLLQTTLGTLFFVMVLGWILLTTNAIFDNRPATAFFWALPAIFE
ncbi:hypothetical protein [Natrinema gari]|uniref:Uncharacterized protein n=1 Tax=Natrinema gari JCM 14663 TaxID=1230459 RepID=L9YSF2_9EURY|nr:hypothetical protein [Natrinema gari]ELY77150.1 hypothetical protein C486_16915 [Natrinema gari JCM 14663]